MDVFYYWKNFEADIRDGRVGWLKSSRDKLNSFKDRAPDYIWAFNTPTGCKGQLQLLARLVWSDTPTVKIPLMEAQSMVFYAPDNPNTVRYQNTGTIQAIEEVTEILHDAIPPSSFRGNFQGENGQHGLEHDAVRKLNAFASKYPILKF